MKEQLLCKKYKEWKHSTNVHVDMYDKVWIYVYKYVNMMFLDLFVIFCQYDFTNTFNSSKVGKGKPIFKENTLHFQCIWNKQKKVDIVENLP
jgi:hypothetical protein